MLRRLAPLAILLVASTARAEDVVAYQAEGDAAVTATDPRVAALDDAFAHATASALSDLVAPDVRTAHQDDLDREIVQHARLWVVKFSVTRDETDGDTRELSVSVKIDRDRIRAKLAQLGIAVLDAAAVPDAAAATHTAAILLRVAAPSGVQADFGASAVPDVPGLAALAAAAHDAGYALRTPASSGPPARADGDVPVDDPTAAQLATDAKAELALVAGVAIGAPVPVRGQPGTAQLVTAHVRLVTARDHQALGQGVAVTAAVGDGLVGAAAGSALLAAASDALPSAPARLAQAGAYRGDDAPIAELGVVLVRLPSHTPLELVMAEEHYLALARGVQAATLRRLSPRGWVIGVRTDQPAEQVAQMARRPPTGDTSADVKIANGIVEVTLAGGTP